MIEIAEEFIEAVGRRQISVLIPKMIFSKLSRCIPQRFQKLRNRWVFLLKPNWRTRQCHFGEPRAKRRLTRYEGGAACRAALLSVIRYEYTAFIADPVYVRSREPHHAAAVCADVGDADVIAEDD